MRDPRFQALAAQLAGYSTSLRPGDRVLLELTDIPEEMGIALIREVRKAGAMPFLRLNQSRLNREMLSGATEEQYGIIGRHRLAEMWPLALSMTGAVNTSPSGRLHSPAHGMAGSPLMEKEMSVPGPVIFTYSAFSRASPLTTSA